MDFRWAAVIALWTMLSGPIFAGLQAVAPAPRTPPVNAQGAKPKLSPNFLVERR